MPHIIVKLWPGKTDQQKSRLAAAITHDVAHILNYGDDAVSVAFEEISPEDWAGKVYRPDILSHPEQVYKKPGYTM
ncbi:MAG TPA: tautomerase family protein [Haloferula sp.]